MNFNKSAMKNIKERILSGKVLHGSWVNLGSTVSAEILGNAGFDWVLIDLEHGAGNDGIMYQQLQALESTAATPIVRIDELSRPRVQRILDAGASGIMFPRIDSPSEAEMAVKTLYYPPKGVRGMARMVRASGFGIPMIDYLNMQKNIVGIIQIETINALKQVDDISAIDGVDILFVGPSDLSISLGIFGQLDHPSYQQAIKSVAQAAKKYGKASGVLLQNINEYEMYFDLGYRFLSCGGDAAFVSSGATQMAKQMNGKNKL